MILMIQQFNPWWTENDLNWIYVDLDQTMYKNICRWLKIKNIDSSLLTPWYVIPLPMSPLRSSPKLSHQSPWCRSGPAGASVWGTWSPGRRCQLSAVLPSPTSHSSSPLPLLVLPRSLPLSSLYFETTFLYPHDCFTFCALFYQSIFLTLSVLLFPFLSLKQCHSLITLFLSHFFLPCSFCYSI